MTKRPSRLVRRLDDGRIVYRLHQRAKAVVLRNEEYERVEVLVKRSTLTQVFLALAICLAATIAYSSPSLRLLGIVATALLLVVVTMVERRYRRDIDFVLDRALTSVADNLGPRPSFWELFRSYLKTSVSTMSDGKLRRLMFSVGFLFVAGLTSVVTAIFGASGPKPDFSPFITALLLVICPLVLKGLFAERRRRIREKQTKQVSNGV